MGKTTEGEAAASQPISGECLARRLRVLAQRAAQGKRRAGGVARFLLDIDRAAFALADELRFGRYQPTAGRAVWIFDPKPRWIYALPFCDRVQHLLIEQTLPFIERRLRVQTFACCVGFGTHRALQGAADLHRTQGRLFDLPLVQAAGPVSPGGLWHVTPARSSAGQAAGAARHWTT